MTAKKHVSSVQNKKMKEYFESNWPEFKGIVELQVFDYLSECDENQAARYNYVVKYAGSLEYKKWYLVSRVIKITLFYVSFVNNLT